MEHATDRPCTDSGEHNQYLTFQLGSEMYALDILGIREIIEYGGATPVPMMPDCLRGVINLRGVVVPVVDLCVRFGCGSSATTKRTCVVIVEVPDEEGLLVMGIVVDAVSAVIEIAPEDIAPPPAFGTHVRTDFIRGMGNVDGRFVIILDVGRVLSAEDLILNPDAIDTTDHDAVREELPHTA
ncbi:MAG: chemotaxis protein CheW [Pseudomonadota bacterium]